VKESSYKGRPERAGLIMQRGKYEGEIVGREKGEK
jgi:hypothetical protein